MQATFLKNCWLALKDLIYPARCVACETELSGTEVLLCDSCYQQIDFIIPPFCPICSRPIKSPNAVSEICGACRKQAQLKPRQAKLIVVAGAEYTGLLKDIVHNYKYFKQQYLGKLLFLVIEHNDSLTALIDQTDLLIPIPLHQKREHWRGFNQARIIAKLLAKKHQKPLSRKGVFKRLRNTIPQVNLNHNARATNIKGAFALEKPTLVKDKHITLVDDVYTTGSTAQECAKILHKAGAKSVSLIVVAR